MSSVNPLNPGWNWMRVTFSQIGAGIQYPSDGVGGLAAGASAAERLAASAFAGKNRVLVGGWDVETAIATGALNLVFRDRDDTLTYFFDPLELLAAPTTGNFDAHPSKLLPPPGLLFPQGFGIQVSGAATAGAVRIYFRVLE